MTMPSVLDAVNKTLQLERPSKGLIFCSDSGSQYAPHDYRSERLHSPMKWKKVVICKQKPGCWCTRTYKWEVMKHEENH